MPFNATLFEVVVSLTVTWGMGLLPAVIARYVWVRAPLTPRSANWIAGISCITFFFLFRVLNAASGVSPEDTTRGAVWFLVFAASRWIMIRGQGSSPASHLLSVSTSAPQSEANSLSSEPSVDPGIAAPEGPNLNQPQQPTSNAWFRAPRFMDSSGSNRARLRVLTGIGFAAAGLVFAVNMLPQPQAEEVHHTTPAQPTATEDRFARAERLASAEETLEKMRLDSEAANDLMKRNRLAKELRLTPSEIADLPQALRMLEKQGKASDEIDDANYVAIELQRLKLGRKCGASFSERLRQAERAYIQCSYSSNNAEMGQTSLCANREYEKLGFPDRRCPQDGPDFICPDPNGPTDAYFISSKQPCE